MITILVKEIRKNIVRRGRTGRTNDDPDQGLEVRKSTINIRKAEGSDRGQDQKDQRIGEKDMRNLNKRKREKRSIILRNMNRVVCKRERCPRRRSRRSIKRI